LRRFAPIFFTRCSLQYAPTNRTLDQSLVRPDLCLNDIWLRNFKKGKCQFKEILRCPEYVNLQKFSVALSMSIYRDFMVPEHVNLQRFCLDFMVPRVRQFTEISWCPEYVNLQRFYGAPSMSIYRDFMEPRVCQFTEILWCPEYVNLQRFCRDFIVPRVCQFTEILWCPDYVNLQRFCRIRLNMQNLCKW